MKSTRCPYSKVINLPHRVDTDSEKWPILLQAKAKACSTSIADFQDVTKDLQLKEDKKECLIEMIGVLDGLSESLLTEHMVGECFRMISTNLFRTFTNKSKSVKMTV